MRSSPAGTPAAKATRLRTGLDRFTRRYIPGVLGRRICQPDQDMMNFKIFLRGKPEGNGPPRGSGITLFSSRIYRGISVLAYAVAARGQNLAVVSLLVLFGNAKNVEAFGGYTSLQLLVGYGLTLSLPFVHGRLYFSTKAGVDRGAVISQSLALFLCAFGGWAILIAAAHFARLNVLPPLLRPYAPLLALSLCAYLISEHFVTTARVTNDLPLLWASAITKLGLLPVFGVSIYIFRTTDAFSATLIYYSVGCAISCVIGYMRHARLYTFSKISANDALAIIVFAASMSFDPICQWITVVSGRYVVQVGGGRGFAGGYTLYSFLITTLSMIGFIIYDTFRIVQFEHWAQGNFRDWFRSYRRTVLASGIFHAVVLLSVLSIWSLWNAFLPHYRLAGEWRFSFTLSVLGAWAYGAAQWGALAMKRLRLINIASAIGASTYLLVLLLLSREAQLTDRLVTATGIAQATQGFVAAVLIGVSLFRSGIITFRKTIDDAPIADSREYEAGRYSDDEE